MDKRPYVVAVAGGTCSGKSTLAELLKAHFSPKCRLTALHMDSYFKNPTPTTIAPVSGIAYPEHNHPDALDLDRFFRDLGQAVNGVGDLVLVEGLFALYLPEIRKAADLKLFVDLPEEARFARRINKHMGFGQTLEQVTGRYVDTVAFRHRELIEPTRWHADLVLNGNLEANQGAALVTHWLAQKLGL